jgi:hypothetical protein
MKSLMRMSKPPFNTNRREDANAATGIAADPVASPVLSGKPDSKAEQKSLAAGDVSQRLLISRAKELIA